MSKVRTTLTIDEEVLKWVKIRAARTGVSDSAVIEESLRRDLKLDVLDALWANATMSETKA
ncbi:MAG TPA: ribbon-helix-helix protein, CopG family, partial [Solirubrobacteraceae bacterium]|nr:ribbon-helix-helix protein, CopG family [Solirubrobacteraceae bacterium]